MEKSVFGYSIERFSNRDLCRYTLQQDGVYMISFTNLVHELGSLATMTENLSKVHTHDFYNVSWVEEGCFYFSVDTEKIFVPNKSIIMFSPGGLYAIESNNSILGTTVNFSEEYFHCIEPAWARFIKYGVMQGIHVLPIHNKETEEEINKCISQLHYYVNNDNHTLSSVAKVYSELTLLLCTIFDSAEHSAKKCNNFMNSANHNLYLSFINLVEQFFSQNHKVQFYADKLHVGASVLDTCCKTNVAKTPLEIITARIILEAKRRLFYTEMTCKEISNILGFIEPAHFTNFFKKNVGMTPAEYRELNHHDWK